MAIPQAGPGLDKPMAGSSASTAGGLHPGGPQSLRPVREGAGEASSRAFRPPTAAFTLPLPWSPPRPPPPHPFKGTFHAANVHLSASAHVSQQN